MTAKRPAQRPAPVRGSENDRRRGSRQRNRTDRKKDAASARTGAAARRRERPTRGKQQRPQRSGPQTAPLPHPIDDRGRPKNSGAAKARAKARKAKAPKVVRPPLRQRVLTRLASIDWDPRSWASRVPFVVLVIGSLGMGLGVTLWLSTGAAERSYQLGNVRETNQTLLQHKEALERDVLEAQAAPALAEAARELGMIPSRDTAHLVQDPLGHWVVIGTPKPAEGVPPPPLNTPLPERTAAPPPPPPAQVVDQREVPVRVPSPGERQQPHLPGEPGVPGAVPLAVPGVEVPHGAAGAPEVPGPVPLPADPAALPGVDPAADPAAGPAPVADPAAPVVDPAAPVADAGEPLPAPPPPPAAPQAPEAPQAPAVPTAPEGPVEQFSAVTAEPGAPA